MNEQEADSYKHLSAMVTKAFNDHEENKIGWAFGVLIREIARLQTKVERLERAVKPREVK